jgi:hypothetical protein
MAIEHTGGAEQSDPAIAMPDRLAIALHGSMPAMSIHLQVGKVYLGLSGLRIFCIPR